jgi:hypothetical protein
MSDVIPTRPIEHPLPSGRPGRLLCACWRGPFGRDSASDAPALPPPARRTAPPLLASQPTAGAPVPHQRPLLAAPSQPSPGRTQRSDREAGARRPRRRLGRFHRMIPLIEDPLRDGGCIELGTSVLSGTAAHLDAVSGAVRRAEGRSGPRRSPMGRRLYSSVWAQDYPHGGGCRGSVLAGITLLRDLLHRTPIRHLRADPSNAETRPVERFSVQCAGEDLNLQTQSGHEALKIVPPVESRSAVRLRPATRGPWPRRVRDHLEMV